MNEYTRVVKPVLLQHFNILIKTSKTVIAVILNANINNTHVVKEKITMVNCNVNNRTLKLLIPIKRKR